MNKKELNDFFSQIADRIEKLSEEEIAEMDEKLKDYEPPEDEE